MSNIVQSLPRPKVIFTGPEGNWLSNLNISYLNAFCGFQGGFIDVSWTWNVNTYTYKISGSLKNSFNSVEKSKSRWHLKKGHFEDTLNIQTLCYSTTCLFRATQNYTLEAEQRFFFFSLSVAKPVVVYWISLTIFLHRTKLLLFITSQLV